MQVRKYIIECSLERLKVSFGALKRGRDIKTDDVPFTICACFLLHNYHEVNKKVSVRTE